MPLKLRLEARTLAAAAAVTAAVGVGVPAGSGAAPTPGCRSFDSQAAAQEYLFESGGSPSRAVGHLDRDHDGVACEGFPGPYEGFATLGYNRQKRFFYGFASMPPAASGKEGFACLRGNRHGPEGPRRVIVFKARPGPDLLVLGRHRGRAKAMPRSGRLVWKADKSRVTKGLYYATFEEREPLTPYGKNECPAFSSRPVRLG